VQFIIIVLTRPPERLATNGALQIRFDVIEKKLQKVQKYMVYEYVNLKNVPIEL